MWPQHNPLPWKRRKNDLNKSTDPPDSWTKFANFTAEFDDLEHFGWEFHWCRSIAVGMLYISTFESNVIGWSVRSQNSRKDRSPAGAATVVQRRFAPERSLASNWSQKNFYRAFQDLSNGLCFNSLRHHAGPLSSVETPGICLTISLLGFHTKLPA